MALPASASAQARYRTTQDENFRQQPGPDARLLGTVLEGAELAAGELRDGWLEVTLEGWIWGRSVGPTTRDGHNLIVNARSGENLRANPNGRVIARLAEGFLLDEVERREGWVRVRRSGWMWARSLDLVSGAPSTAAADPPDDPPPAREGTEPPDLDRGVTAQRVELRRVPDGAPWGTLAEGAPVRVLARSGEWIRVSAEGWIRETDLRPAAAGVLVGVSGAEVRSRPREFEGKVVQWTVQYVALQTADELRREIPQGQRYMLARGPLPEAGFVYVMLSPAQVPAVEQLEPLAEVVIIARIRAARSQYLGNPVVELVDLSAR
jgi:hypothetical protein